MPGTSRSNSKVTRSIEALNESLKPHILKLIGHTIVCQSLSPYLDGLFGHDKATPSIVHLGGNHCFSMLYNVLNYFK